MWECSNADLKRNYKIIYDFKTDTFSMHTKAHTIVCDVNEWLHTFIDQVTDVMTAKYDKFTITKTSDSLVFTYTKLDGQILSEEVSYLKCYEFKDRPYCFVTWHIN